MSAHTLANDLFNAGLATMLIALVASLGLTYSVRQTLEPPAATDATGATGRGRAG